MLAELLARSGQAVLRDVAPDGRRYWGTRFWDRDAAERHPVLAPEFLRQKETIGQHLGRAGGEATRVLEFACGTGVFTALAASLTPAKQIVALDISAQALRIARGRVEHDNLTLIEGDFWADHDLGTADLVLCVDAIHHLGGVRRVLERLGSFMTPGGVLIGNVWTADNYHEFQRKRYGALGHLGRTAGFLATAVLIRASGGRLRTGAYRTQLVSARQVQDILRSTFAEVYAVSEPYFISFVCRS
jgi:SAM-dependent methyltransferase